MSYTIKPGDRCPECKEIFDKKTKCACTRPNWDGECMNCGASPIVPITGMCGPCTFGEADTMGGNW